jgi:hypothetical protein
VVCSPRSRGGTGTGRRSAPADPSTPATSAGAPVEAASAAGLPLPPCSVVPTALASVACVLVATISTTESCTNKHRTHTNLTIHNCRRTELGIGRGGDRARGTDHLGAGAARRRGARATASGSGIHVRRGEGAAQGSGSDGSGSGWRIPAFEEQIRQRALRFEVPRRRDG